MDIFTHRRALLPVINRISACLWLDPDHQVNSMEMVITNSGGTERVVTLSLVPGVEGLQVKWEDSGETEVWPRLPRV
jgi:hypothetical protein